MYAEVHDAMRAFELAVTTRDHELAAGVLDQDFELAVGSADQALVGSSAALLASLTAAAVGTRA